MKDGIVAGGRRQARRSPEYKAAVRALRAEIRAEFEPLFAQAGLLGKASLWVRRQRRIERETEALAPGRGLYWQGSCPVSGRGPEP